MNQLHLPDHTEGLVLGLARGPSFLQMKFWLDTCLELVAPVPTRRAQGLDLGLARGPQFPPEEVSRAPVFFFVSSTRVDQAAGAMFGWAWLEAFCLQAIKP